MEGQGGVETGGVQGWCILACMCGHCSPGPVESSTRLVTMAPHLAWYQARGTGQVLERHLILLLALLLTLWEPVTN